MIDSGPVISDYTSHSSSGNVVCPMQRVVCSVLLCCWPLARHLVVLLCDVIAFRHLVSLLCDVIASVMSVTFGWGCFGQP